jgi:hypothetical protein
MPIHASVIVTNTFLTLSVLWPKSLDLTQLDSGGNFFNAKCLRVKRKLDLPICFKFPLEIQEIKPPTSSNKFKLSPELGSNYTTAILEICMKKRHHLRPAHVY